MKTYIIPKGWHYSLHLPKPYLGIKKNFNIKVKFTDSCRYNLNNADQQDINKLFGVSFGSHQDNSIRIGWNYNLVTGEIDIYSYEYERGIRWLFTKIGSVAIGDLTYIDLSLAHYTYSIRINDGISGFGNYIFNYPAIKLGYYLYPYFGGNQPAPHDVKIEMEVN